MSDDEAAPFSEIKDSYIATRNQEDVFIPRADGGFDIRLIGYVLVPVEDYEEHADNVRRFHETGRID